MGTLYLVATPIGNLEDLSPRAQRLLRQVVLVAAEDTRHTLQLLNHFNIRNRLVSYHEHNKLSRLDEVLAALETGDVALVSDAGTPALNDPGYELVRAALEAGYPVSPVPGPSAPIAALVASGLPTDAFVYLGYLPRKTVERQRFLFEVSPLPYTLVFLESPHRLLDALADLEEVLGDRQTAVARELTKLYEEIFRGTLSQAQAHFAAQPPKGEFTLVIAGLSTLVESWDEDHLDFGIQSALQSGIPASQAAASLAQQSGWPRRKIYQRIIAMQKAAGKDDNPPPRKRSPKK